MSDCDPFSDKQAQARFPDFSDKQAVARYTEAPPRIVPGFTDMQRMALLLLSERSSRDAQILVLGAGGGLELKAFAEAEPGWRFCGVDPSAEMLKLAAQTLGNLASQVSLIHGYIDDAPVEPFDGASCILTLHFVPLEERRRIASEIRRRLKPGAPLVVTHLSVPEEERRAWLSRYSAFSNPSGFNAENASAIADMFETQLNILTPEQDRAILSEAGFSNIGLFYAGFAFRGWVAYA